MREKEPLPHLPWMAATSLSVLKPRLRSALMPLAGNLARRGVMANQITVLSIVVSIALGLLLALYPGQPAWHALVPLWLVGRTVLASLDGTLAVCFGQKSRIGGFLNEAGDIASDIALYAPLALVNPFTPTLVALVLSLVVAGELAGVCMSGWAQGVAAKGHLARLIGRWRSALLTSGLPSKARCLPQPPFSCQFSLC